MPCVLAALVQYIMDVLKIEPKGKACWVLNSNVKSLWPMKLLNKFL